MNACIEPRDEVPLVEVAEALLGNPFLPDRPLSLAYSQHIDESEEFPEAAIAELYRHRLNRHFVPVALGGEFRSFVELADLIRVLARRDITSAVAFATQFWSFLTWIDGSDAQRRFLADFILRRDGTMCLAYSEKEHGSDLVGGSTVATPAPGGYLLTGEKWPINRATVGDLAFVLATTDPDIGPRGLSLFMLDKAGLDKARYSNLPKVPTLGMRGSDISGIKFDQCHVPADSVVGGHGRGLEVALKGFQVTRALCAALSLGSGDTALRTTLHFAADRKLYKERVIDMPHAARALSDAYVDLLACDCVTQTALRAFHAVPEQVSVWSAVAKYYVPTAVESMIHDLSVIMGARGYIRDEHEWGTFQRVLRDASIVSIFDGSTVVNLHALLLQFRQLARRPSGKDGESGRLKAIYDLTTQVETFDGRRMAMVSRHGNYALDGLPTTLAILKGEACARRFSPEVRETLLAIGAALTEEIEAHQRAYAESDFEYGHRQSAEAFDMAHKYCGLNAAVSCLHTCVHTEGHPNAYFASGKWLGRAVARIFKAYLGRPAVPWEQGSSQDALDELRRLDGENRMFSVQASKLGV